MGYRNKVTGAVVEACYLVNPDEVEWELSIDDVADFLHDNGIEAEVYDFNSFITLEGEDKDLDVDGGSYVIIDKGVVSTLMSMNFWEQYEELGYE